MLGLFALASAAGAQAPPSGKTLASTINVYVFPNSGQNSSQQSKDEGECYNWAVTNTGSDPFELQKQAASSQQQTQQQVAAAQRGAQGAGARGAVGGAATGALIGAIADEDKSEARRPSKWTTSRKRSVSAWSPSSTWSSTDDRLDAR
jgi:hypothetical protein